MFALFTFFLLLSCVVVHELGHAYAILRRGIRVKEIGIGIPVSKYLGFSINAPSWLPCQKLGFHLLLLGGYTVPADDQQETLENLSYWDYANIMGAGIWANLLMALVILGFFLPIYVENDLTINVIIIIAVALICLLMWFGQNFFTGIVFPLLAPLAIFLLYLVFTAKEAAQVGGPIEIFKQVGSMGSVYQSLSFVIDISISLAILNSLPLMPLDGGQLYAFLARKISKNTGRIYSLVSALISIAFLLFIFVRDIVRLISNLIK